MIARNRYYLMATLVYGGCAGALLIFSFFLSGYMAGMVKDRRVEMLRRHDVRDQLIEHRKWCDRRSGAVVISTADGKRYCAERLL